MWADNRYVEEISGQLDARGSEWQSAVLTVAEHPANQVSMWRIASADIGSKVPLSASEQAFLETLPSETAGHELLARRVVTRLALTALGIPIAHDTHPSHGTLKVPGVGALHYTSSSSLRTAVCAVTRVGAIGLSVEEHVAYSYTAALADTFCSHSERRLLDDTDGTLNLDRFTRVWAGKEALFPLVDGPPWPGVQDLAFDATESCRLIACPASMGEPADWSTVTASPADRTTAVAVVRGRVAQTQLFEASR